MFFVLPSILNRFFWGGGSKIIVAAIFWREKMFRRFLCAQILSGKLNLQRNFFPVVLIIIGGVVSSVTRLGDFFNFRGTIFLTIVAKIFLNFLGEFEIHYSSSKNCCGHLLGYFLFQHLVTLVVRATASC